MPRSPPLPAPEGLRYVPGFLDDEAQQAVWREAEAAAYRSFEMHGVVAKRTVAFFGWDYGYDRAQLLPGPPMPPWIVSLRERCERLAELPRGAFEQALINRYPEGAGIGWHQDAPMFGPVVAGVSLGAPARMRFRPTKTKQGVYELTLEPGSAYVIGGKARAAWQHLVPPLKGLRYSITFRTVRPGWAEKARARALGAGVPE